ncbi:MAG: histidine kinase N-terminal 7TM domain-containing protein [Chloroflexota bacterium]|nr:histidine kinase N-terminal 7TM domain-containing protein [Chloroflexota bacterium]
MQITHLYIIALRVAALVTLGIAFYSWQQRKHTPAARSFTFLMLATFLWAGGYSMELGCDTIPAILRWSQISYIGVVYTSLLWFIFALQYADWKEFLTRRNIFLLATPSTLNLLVKWTNGWHHWYYTSYQLEIEGTIHRIQFTRGAISWVFIMYSYLLLLLGTLVLIWLFIRSPRPYRHQLSLILVGALVPWLANLAHLFEADILSRLDATPMAFSITGMLIGWGLFRLRLLDLVPIARDKVMENIHDGVIILDMRLRLIDLNPRARELFPAEDSPLIGKPVSQVLAGQLNLAALFQAEQDTSTSITIKTSCSQRDYDLFLSHLKDQRQQLSGWLLVLHDVTERNRAEQALRQQTLTLARQNAELDAFAHTVAHDLKNPLTVMVGFSLWLENNVARIPLKKSEENLHRISCAGRKMANIIDELLLLANVRSKDDINTAPLDMAKIVAAAEQRLSVMIAEHHGKLTLPESWPLASGYAPWVEEVWVNYISNALKYGGTPPQLTFGATPVASAGTEVPYYRFWLRDNGAGLTGAQQNQLFTEFTRLEQSRTAGHGLGLSIVKRIIGKLGGQVGVQSEVGVGSEFSFTLPTT